MLDTIVKEKILDARAIVGFWPAAAVGEDIEVYENDATRDKPVAKFYGLRQQAEKDSESNEPYYSLSDFVAPKELNILDHIGAFAVSVGFGVDEKCAEYAKTHDDYSSIMLKALADRLTEALAEKLHEDVRKDHWGYSPTESLSVEDMLSVSYQGIRPAPGYPSQPDHTEKNTMWELMNITAQTGIGLTESLAMVPAAAVSGIYFGNREARYFAVGKVGRDQVEGYAGRKGMSVEGVERWLGSSLSYDV